MKVDKIIIFLSAFVLIVLSSDSVSFADWDRHRGHYYRYHDRPVCGSRTVYIPQEAVVISLSGDRYYYYDGLYYNRMGGEYVLVNPPVGATVYQIPPDFVPVIVNGTTYYTDNGVYYLREGYRYKVVSPPVIAFDHRPAVESEILPVRQNQTKVVEGAGVGGILGALLGGIVGHQMKGRHTGEGVLVGGVGGAVAGGIIGAQIPNENASRPSTAQSNPTYVKPQTNYSATSQILPDNENTIPVNIPNNHGDYTTVVIKKSGDGFTGPQGEYYPEFPKVSQLKAMYGK